MILSFSQVPDATSTHFGVASCPERHSRATLPYLLGAALGVRQTRRRRISHFREMQQYRTSCSSDAQNSIPVRFKCSKRVDVALPYYRELSRDATVSHFVLFDCSELHSRAFHMPCSRA